MSRPDPGTESAEAEDSAVNRSPAAPSLDLPKEGEGTAISGRLVFLGGLGGMLLLALVAGYLTFVRGITDESGNTPVAGGASPGYSAPVFATTLSANGLPPAGAVPSGGTLGSCPIRELWAYVSHANVPVGTQLTGSWTFHGQPLSNNPTFATDSVHGTTNYSLSTAQGLAAGAYAFVLRAGSSQVSSGTVTIAC